MANSITTGEYISVMEQVKHYMDAHNQKCPFKSWLCKSCSDDGHTRYGECATCRRHIAENIEWLETHPAVFDDALCNYHSSAHNVIKRIPLHLPHENSYLLHGIEDEVDFDNEMFERDEDYDDDCSNCMTTGYLDETLREFARITKGLCVFERDCSLRNGVELIFRPMSYAYLTHPDTIAMLRAGYDYLKSRGATVDQPVRNGMHVHISRKFFERGHEKDAVDAKTAYKEFDWLFQIYQPEIERFGGRKYTTYCASKAQDLVDRLKGLHGGNNVDLSIKAKLKKGGEPGNDDHHTAVNSDAYTIEARVFKSTVDVEQLIANVEMVRNFAYIARSGLAEQRTLDEILHTKNSMFLDKIVQRTRMLSYKAKEKFDVQKKCANEIAVDVDA